MIMKKTITLTDNLLRFGKVKNSLMTNKNDHVIQKLKLWQAKYICKTFISVFKVGILCDASHIVGSGGLHTGCQVTVVIC